MINERHGKAPTLPNYTFTVVLTDEQKKVIVKLAKTDRFCLESKGEILRFLINQGIASPAAKELI
jgi:hypothetical protein